MKKYSLLSEYSLDYLTISLERVQKGLDKGSLAFLSKNY